ncbi:MAG: hypothetical protein AAGJ83_10530 [Planctomycetota bacterium]
MSDLRNQIENLDRICAEMVNAYGGALDRSSHRGKQPIDSISGLAVVLAQKANGSELHARITLHPESDPGLTLDGQELRYQAPVIPEIKTPELPEIPPPTPPTHAEPVQDLNAIEPAFGVIYAVDGDASYMLNADGSQWVRLGALA